MAQGDVQIRLLPAVFVPRPHPVLPVASLGQGGALLGQLVQHLPPQGVHRRQRHRQTVLHQSAHTDGGEGGAPGLGKLGLHLLLGGGAAAGRLGELSGGGGHPALPVLHSHLDGFPRPDHGVELHRNAGAFPLLIGGLGLREQLPGGLGLLPHAKHIRPGPAQVVAVGEALPGKGLLQLAQLLRGGLPALPEGIGVHLGDDIDVLRPLHAALDLRAGHPHLLKLPQMPRQGHILEGQGVAVGQIPEAVGQAAGLGAHTPVAAAPADDGGQEALPGVAHTQRPVDEHLDLDGGVLADVGDVRPGQLPGQHRPGDAQIRGLLHPVQTVEGHLGGGVEGQVGGGLPQGAHQPQVLDQGGVHAQLGRLDGAVHRVPHLPVGAQGVKGEVHLHPPEMAVGNRRGKFVPAEVPGTPAGVELSEAQIDRVRPCAHRGAQGLRASCGG